MLQTCKDTSSHSTEVEARTEQRVQTISAATSGEDKTWIQLLITKKRRKEKLKRTKNKHVSETPPPAGDSLLKLSSYRVNRRTGALVSNHTIIKGLALLNTDPHGRSLWWIQNKLCLMKWSIWLQSNSSSTVVLNLSLIAAKKHSLRPLWRFLLNYSKMSEL